MLAALELLPRHVVRHYDNGEEEGDGEGVYESQGCDEDAEGVDGEERRRRLCAVGRRDYEGRHEHRRCDLATAERTNQTYAVKNIYRRPLGDNVDTQI